MTKKLKRTLVSIIVPFYNVEKYIEECLDSILSQTWEDIELILIDDRGNDRSLSIVEKKLSTYKGKKSIRVITNDRNVGIAESRNVGISAARGNFIMFVDSDDYLCDNNAISKMVLRQQETQADIVVANSIMFDDATGKIFKVVDKDYIDAVYENSSDRPDWRLGDVVWSRLIRADFIKKNDLYFNKGILYEDAVWTFKLTCSSPRLSTMSDKIYRYRYRAGSIMNTQTRKHIFSHIVIPVICGKWLAKHPTSKKTYAACVIADKKIGAYMNLMRTGNKKLCRQVFGLYKRIIPHITPGDTTLRERIKICISHFPMNVYMLFLKIWNKKCSKGRQKLDTIKLNDSFMDEITLFIKDL